MFKKIIIVMASVLLIAYLGSSLFLYQQLATVIPHCNNQFSENTPADFDASPYAPELDVSSYWMTEYETVEIPSRDAGITLNGWYIGGTHEKAILVVHGLGVGTADCKQNPRALLMAGMLHRGGYNVLMVDLREHGESSIEDGKWAAGTEEYRDVLAAWEWLKNKKGFSANKLGWLLIPVEHSPR